MEDLRMKYRPKNISEVWGNEHIKMIWAGLVKRSCYPKSIVLHGPFGTCKTTLARIFANDITANNSRLGNGLFENLYEIDAAKRDIEYMKRFINKVSDYAHEPMVIFVDEVQRLMDRSQDLFLKTIEDSPNLYFIFATTEKEKIDGGILSRSAKFHLRNLSATVLLTELSNISRMENINITNEALKYLIEFSNFNPRECLGNLDIVRGFEEIIDAEKIKECLNG